MAPLHYVLVLVFMLAFDAVWIGSNVKFYGNAVSDIQLQPMKVNILATVLAYVFIYVTLVRIALPAVERSGKADGADRNCRQAELAKSCVIHAGGLGILVYGVYNLTTKALLTKYPWKVCALDTMWGGVMFTAVCFCTMLIAKLR